MTVPQVSTRRAWWLATRPFLVSRVYRAGACGHRGSGRDRFRPAAVPARLRGRPADPRRHQPGDRLLRLHAWRPADRDAGRGQPAQRPAQGVGRAQGCGRGVRAGLVVRAGNHRDHRLAGRRPILAAGVFSVLAGYFYTAKPIMYGRRGLGETHGLHLHGRDHGDGQRLRAAARVDLARLPGVAARRHPGRQHPARQQPARHRKRPRARTR